MFWKEFFKNPKQNHKKKSNTTTTTTTTKIKTP